MIADQIYLLVTGEAGSGKSALLANWIHQRKEDMNHLLLYHFAGCAEGTCRETLSCFCVNFGNCCLSHLYAHGILPPVFSTGAKDVAVSLLSQLEKALLTVQQTLKRKELQEKLKSQYNAVRGMDLRELMSEFSEKLRQKSDHFPGIVIVVDGLEKLSENVVSNQVKE